MTPALAGERIELATPSGRVSFYVAGDGPPFLLVHSVNAAASAAEVRPIFDRYRATRTVYAMDLPGYGYSERRGRVYTPPLMAEAILAVAARAGSGIDGLAVSLGCELLARAAVMAPGTFRSLALVSPTGLSGRRIRRAPPGTTLFKPWIYAIFRTGGIGRMLFRGLTRPAVIRYFLRRTWGGSNIDAEMAERAIENARVPGAEHAPISFLTGALFSDDIHDVYDQIRVPVWACHGERGDFVDYRQLPLFPKWSVTTFPTGALPYFEVPDRFFAALDDALAR